MPKSKEQNNLIKDERKNTIIESATTLFAIHSYKSISVDNITQAANCSHGLFYHYFSSKEDIFHAVMESAIKTIESKMFSIREIKEPQIKLQTIIHNILNMINSDSNYYVHVVYLLLNLRLQEDSIPKPKEKIPKDRKPINRLIYELIEAGQKEGVFVIGDPREYTICVMAMLKGLAYNRIYVGNKRFICPNENVVMNLVNKK